MSHIEDLIEELCPNGVEYRPLGEIATTVAGLRGKTRADFGSGNAPFASYTNVLSNPSLDLDAQDRVQIREGERQNSLSIGDIVITGSSESVEEVGMSSVVTTDPPQPTYLNSFCFIVRPNRGDLFIPGFTKHLFRSEPIRQQIRRTASGVTRINVSKARFMKVPVPIPPLGVQQEIVRILDKFTALEAELEAELEARGKQYEHARHLLLHFDDDVRLDALASVARVSTGAAVSKAAIDSNPGPYPVINSGRDPLGYIADFNTDDDPIGITSRGANVGSVTWCDGKYFRGNLNYGVSVRDCRHLDQRFLFHVLRNSASKISALCTFQGIPALNKARLEKLTVPVPPLDEQRRIADILDKFDALVNDLSVGLPAELAARRKQYEYYRDRLLTFKELAA